VTNLTFNAANNRITTSGYSYDSVGNTTADPSGKTFTYDAENKQKTAVVNGYTNEYFYDGDGKRVKKVVPSSGETTVFVYDATGKLVAEYSTIVASAQDAKVAYLTNDHLGSPRINTDATGAVTARHDYHPFGEEIDGSGGRTTGLGYQADGVRKQFTGYERDIDTGLDFAQARMYNPAHGRFTAVDPLKESAAANNPQSWNRYVYTFNNPLNYVDPTGLVAMDDYYINRDGSWTVVETQCQCDTYNIETQAGSGEYRELGTLQRNAAGLVEFPGEMNFFTRYGAPDAGGVDRVLGETVGQGDHFVRPDVAAGLFGLSAVLKDDYGITMSFGDMSSSNGSDPWQPSFVKNPNRGHHGGHGHLGDRSGLDIDFRYINNNGESFQGKKARSSSDFSVANNQAVYNVASTFGFTVNYQGNSQGRNTGLTGPQAIGGHNDHGHLGFSGNGRSQTSAKVSVVTHGAVKRLVFR